MNLRLFTAALLVGTALSSVAIAQNAQQPAQSGDAQPNGKKHDTRAMGGLTAAPTDIGRIDVNGAGAGGLGSVKPDGVTGKEIGGGNMIEEDAVKTRSTVTRDAIAQASPTANPYQLINLLPGVLQFSTDNAGLNGGDINIHGFRSSEIGLTIEGAPVNDSGNYALYPQEYVDAENIGQVSVAQGSADLDSPHYGATAGIINIYMRDPSKVMGGFYSQTFGGPNLSREFMRLESGQVGAFRAYASYSHYYSQHWQGPGADKRDHVDFKGVWDISANDRISLSVIYNNAINNFYPNPTLAQFNSNANYQYLSALPSTYFTSSNQAQNSASSFYQYRINPFRNLIVSMPSSFGLTSNLTYDVVPYFWYGFGSGGGVSTLNEQPAGSSSGSGTFFGTYRLTGIDWNRNGTIASGETALFYTPSITETLRPGIVNKLTYQLGEHKFVLGYWFEFAMHEQTGPFIPLNADGSVADPFANSGGYIIPSGPYTGSVLQKRNSLTETMTNMVFVGDTWSLMNDRLNIDLGVKEAIVNRRLWNYIPGSLAFFEKTNAETLPTAGVRFKIDGENQIFASISTTFHVAPNYNYLTAYNVNSGKLSTDPQAALAVEKALTVELGHRYQGELFASSVSLFSHWMQNYQLSSNGPDPSGSASTASVTKNVGRVNSYGIDAEFGTRPLWGGFRPYVSGQLMKTRLNDNLPTATSTGILDYLPTVGKQLPATPNFIGSVGLYYDNGFLFGNLSAKYVGPQYTTLMNDEKIPGYARLDAMVGYRLPDYGFLKAPQIKLNLYNIANSRQLTGPQTIQNNAVATKGVNGNTLGASTPFYYVAQGFSWILTVSSGF
jgi:iron complex outermembrane receptor protein